MRSAQKLAIAAALAAVFVGSNPASKVEASPVSSPITSPIQADARPLDSAVSSDKKIYSVAAMGDSLTDPKSQGGKYLAYLQSKCPKSRFDSWGKGGNMVNQMRRRFAKDVFGEGSDETKPTYTHVIILGGIGDILSNETAGRTAEKIEKDLGEMYRIAHEHKAAVIALTLPPWGQFKDYDDARHKMTLAVNKWINDAPPNVDSVVDIYPRLSCGVDRDLCKDYAWPDQLHWSVKGHEVVGAYLYQEIFSDCE